MEVAACMVTIELCPKDDQYEDADVFFAPEYITCHVYEEYKVELTEYIMS